MKYVCAVLPTLPLEESLNRCSPVSGVVSSLIGIGVLLILARFMALPHKTRVQKWLNPAVAEQETVLSSR